MASPSRAKSPSPTRPTADVILVASGDLREGANKVCWPAQKQMEGDLTRAFAAAGRAARPRPRPVKIARPRLHRQRPRGDRGVFEDRSDGGACRRGGGLAVLQPCSPRALESLRPDPHRCQLVGAVAGTCRDAQPQRLAHQGGRPLRHALGRRLRSRRLPAAISKHGSPPEKSAMTRAMLCRWQRSRCRRSSSRSAPGSPRSPRKEGPDGGLRRGVHGDVQRDHPRPAPPRHRGLQGAVEPIGRCTTRRRKSPTARPARSSAGSSRPA